MATANLDILVQLKDEASAALKGVSSSLTSMQSGLQPAADASKAVGIALLGAGAAAIGFGAMSVKAAMDAQTQMALFNQTLANTKGAGAEQKEAILAAADAAVKLGFDDEDTALSIARLYQHTGDLSEAMKLNSIAMDLAKDKHLDLATAGNLVGLVLEGNGRMLKQYGINLKDSATPLEALGELQDLVSGKAQAVSETLGGQMDVLKIRFEDLQKSVGGKLLPVLTQMLEGINGVLERVTVWASDLQNLTNFLEQHRTVLLVVAGAITGALLPALISLGITLLTVTIPAILAASLALAPWLIGGAIVGGIVAGIIWLVENWKTLWNDIEAFIVPKIEAISNVLTSGWNAIKQVAADVWNAIKTVVVAVIDFIVGAIVIDLDALDPQWRAHWNALVNFLQGIWNGIKSMVSDAMAAISGFIMPILTAISNAWSAAWGGMETFFTGMWDGIKNALQSAIDWITNKLNALVSTVSSIAGVITGPISSVASILGNAASSAASIAKSAVSTVTQTGSSITKLATGGLVTQPTYALVGEAGPEAVIPLNQLSGIGTGGGITVNITGNVYSGKDAAVEMANEIARVLRYQVRM